MGNNMAKKEFSCIGFAETGEEKALGERKEVLINFYEQIHFCSLF